MQEAKQKRQLSPEQLEKLRIAREKALAVRREKAGKMKQLKELEKQAASKEVEQKIEKLKTVVSDPIPKQEEEHQFQPQVVDKVVKKAPKKMPARAARRDDVVKKLVEESTDEESGSDSENENDTDLVKSFLRDKYKAKYKQRYAAKTMGMLTRGIAQQTVKKKLDDEMIRLASMSVFGS